MWVEQERERTVYRSRFVAPAAGERERYETGTSTRPIHDEGRTLEADSLSASRLDLVLHKISSGCGSSRRILPSAEACLLAITFRAFSELTLLRAFAEA